MIFPTKGDKRRALTWPTAHFYLKPSLVSENPPDITTYSFATLYLTPLIESSANFWWLPHPVQSLSPPYNVLTSFLHTHLPLSQSLLVLFFHLTIFWNSPHSWQFCLFWGRSRKEGKRESVMSSALNFKKLMRFFWGAEVLKSFMKGGLDWQQVRPEWAGWYKDT